MHRIADVDRVRVVVLAHNVKRQQATFVVLEPLDQRIGGEFIVRAAQGEEKRRECRVAVDEVCAFIEDCPGSFRYRIDDGLAAGQEVITEKDIERWYVRKVFPRKQLSGASLISVSNLTTFDIKKQKFVY